MVCLEFKLGASTTAPHQSLLDCRNPEELPEETFPSASEMPLKVMRTGTLLYTLRKSESGVACCGESERIQS